MRRSSIFQRATSEFQKWLKAELSLHQCPCVQPSYCLFAIWDTQLCKQLSTHRKNSRLFFFFFFFLTLLCCSCIPKYRSEPRWTIVAEWKEPFQQRVVPAAGILPFICQTKPVSWTRGRFTFWRSAQPGELSLFPAHNMLEGNRRTRSQSRTKKQPPAMLTFSSPPLFTAPPTGGRVNKQDI